ncbi:PREDICTED: translocon-associated protein subunit alpha-like [Camelina sativa]|uniref:Translocon-associated protein subunit alpha n=1 Tax=Camelina sativa TaxID=90675 RepID=A0ABM0ZJB8_CAMSA|nr:PREDICTED: translocon-associated protein subunit alpha-like [Camelina sativa]
MDPPPVYYIVCKSDHQIQIALKKKKKHVKKDISTPLSSCFLRPYFIQLTTINSRPISKTIMTTSIRLLFLAFLLLASPFLKVALCQSDSEDSGFEVSDVGEEESDTEEVFGLELSSAPGVETLCVFPKNTAKIIKAGVETELLVGMKNDGQSNVDIVAVKGSLHLPFDQNAVQNLTALSFSNASVSTSAQATFPYVFAVSKFLQAGAFDLVGTIIYEIDGKPYQSTFYNGTIEVVEDGPLFRMESFFLSGLLIFVIVLLALYIQNCLKHMTKKTKRAPKVEVGTAAKDASHDEWLEGTSYTQSSSKSKKKK